MAERCSSLYFEADSLLGEVEWLVWILIVKLVGRAPGEKAKLQELQHTVFQLYLLATEG